MIESVGRRVSQNVRLEDKGGVYLGWRADIVEDIVSIGQSKGRISRELN